MRLLLFLELRQLANYVRVTLRTPKRLIPAILMAAYFSFVLLMQLFAHGMNRHPSPPMTFGLNVSSSIQSVAFLLMSLALIGLIVRAFSEGMLIFPLSDIDYLFSSPIPRQAILTLKLLGLYVKVGFWGLFVSMFMLPQFLMMVRPSPASVFVGWLGFVLFAAYVINISTLINLIATYREGGKWWLSFVVRAFAYAVILGIAASIGIIARQTGSVAEGLLSTVRHPVVVMLFLPAKWGSDLLLVGMTGLRPLVLLEGLGLACIVAVSYLLVMLRPENPYEPSLTASVRMAAVRAARRSGGGFGIRQAMLQKKTVSKDVATSLPSFGRGAMAIVWKNLNISVRTSGKTLVVAMALVAVMLVVSKVAAPGLLKRSVVEDAASAVLLYAVFIATMVMLQSFRGDLKQANILKPMPIPSWQIIAAQTVGGALLVAALAWTTLILVAVTYGLTQSSLLLLTALCLPAITYGVLCWQAGVAIIYPKWEDQTQQFVGGMLSMFAGGVCIAPPVIAGFIMKALHFGILPISMAVLFISAGMAALGIMLSGYLYSRFDPTDE